MKKLVLIVSFLSIFCLTGCDMFRKLAGRPTSADIEVMKTEILAREAAYQVRIDSLEREKKILADSLATIDSLKQLGGTILNSAAQGGLFTTKLESRYYIIVGAFHNRVNAERLYATIQKEGYTPVIISFRNGYNAVGVSPANKIKEAFQNLLVVREEKFCPKDAWILVNE